MKDFFKQNGWALLIIFLPAAGVFLAIAAFNLVGRPTASVTDLPSGPNKTRVQRVLPGWLDQKLDVRASGAPWRGALITVLLHNSDRWFMDQVSSDPDHRLLASMLTFEEMKAFDEANVSDKVYEAARQKDPDGLALLNAKFQRWHRHCLGELQLMLAGQVFATIKPFDSTLRVTTNNRDTWSQVVFCVEPGDAEKARWEELIRTLGTVCSAPITVAIKVGDANRYMPTEVNSDGDSPQRFDLPLRPWLVRAWAWTALALVITTVLYVSAATRVLRDAAASNLPAGQQPPWSLSRIVLAWWMTICAGCFLFLWAMTDEYNNLSGSAPLLLGINGTTLLFAAAIGSRTVNAEAGAALPPALVSGGFFSDLVSESGQPEISRLQMLVWNGVLGLVFIWQTLAQWKMPEFNATLMTLLGISATAYVGFKFVPPPK